MSGKGENNVGDGANNSPEVNRWSFIGKLFDGLHWLTEKVIGLLRSLVTAAIFLVVAFVIYNAWDSRNTVAVKAFQVPVAMGQKNHEQAGRIIANLLNRHLLEAQSELESQSQRESLNTPVLLSNPYERQRFNTSRPVRAEQQVLIEAGSIKLPETGITIDNVIEFISGVFGRKSLNGLVYYESDLVDTNKTKLHLQITLRGRIISFSEDDLGDKQRKLLPDTQPDGLNIQLISAMFKARSKEILSIAAADYNLYYFCTRAIAIIEHDDSEFEDLFAQCQHLQSSDATPKSLQTLKATLEKQQSGHDNSIVNLVLDHLKKESYKRQLALCQSRVNQADEACAEAKLAKVRPAAKARATEPVLTVNSISRSPVSTMLNSVVDDNMTSMMSPLSVEPVGAAIRLDSMLAIKERCDYLRTEAEGAHANIVPRLEQQCFIENPVQQSSVQQAESVVSPEATLKANQAEGDATQLLRNGVYAESLAKYEEAILLNCNNAVAWANMGILLSTASSESGVLDPVQAQCALFRATTLNENAGWMRHSLCVAQAKQAEGDLGRFLNYESCQLARQLEPINEALYDKLFYIDIGDRYRELEEYEPARDAYVQAMSNETNRSCNMKNVLQSLLALEAKGVADSQQQACKIYQNSVSGSEEETIPECEMELNQLMAAQDCV